MTDAGDLQELFGNIDIYLFDQLLRGRIRSGMRIFDTGCGGGRNLVYLIRAGCEIAAVDRDPRSVGAVRAMVARLAPLAPDSNIRVEAVESNTFPDGWADVVISSAVLHFANDAAQFRAMLDGSWRVLKPSGLFFCRLASSIGIEHQVQSIGNGRYRLPDGSDRFLVSEQMLCELTEQLGGELLDPLKTTVVQNQRSMTTWVVRKRPTEP